MSEAKIETLDNTEIGKLWADYAEKYNRLSGEMSKVNIDIELLTDVVRATINLYTYKQGFRDDTSPLKQAKAGRKPKYIVMEFESHIKDIIKLYGGRTGWLYKLTKVLREYTNEAEVDQDLARLKSGEITEDDIIRKRKKQ